MNIDSIVLELGKILLGIEFLAALIAFYYYFNLKNSYWKWFCVYLIFIFIQEFYWFFNSSLIAISKKDYYAFLGIPIECLFLYWLYALKSLKNKRLFLICVFIYISSYFPIELFYKEISVMYSLNLTIGTILLTVLIILEIRKQIITDNILEFKENKMFCINLGLILFYIGTYPFHAFYDVLLEEPYKKIGDYYYLYFIISNCLMYLLFIASLIWGKHHSK